MPAITRWSRSSGCRWRGWSIASASASSRRRRPRLGAERRDHLVALRRSPARQQLRPGALLGAELAQPQLAPVGEPDQHPRARGPSATRACRRPAAARPTSGGRAAPGRRRNSTTGILPTRRTPRRPCVPTSASSGGSKRLHRDHSRRQRRLDLDALERGAKAARGDLDLGHLGHGSRLGRAVNCSEFIRLPRRELANIRRRSGNAATPDDPTVHPAIPLTRSRSTCSQTRSALWPPSATP